ncbi:MAG TPA: GTPase [Planctomycetota bacterium]|nr:GTPase [Planctomycetota bacterium]
MNTLAAPTVMNTPESVLENYLAVAASRTAPIPVDSEEGRRLYRALAFHIWCRFQRPVVASDIKDLWERIDSIKRGAPVQYGISEIHFWAAEFANALVADSVPLDPQVNQRLAAWLDDWPNVCILGQTGRGKSSTINRIFGVKMAAISHHTSCTSTVTDYRLVTGSFLNRPTGIVLWDVPGYGDDRMSWDTYVKLYRRLARRCDVVVLMVDNDRSLRLDLKMFKKLRKVNGLESKLVLALNKADLFFPCNWSDERRAPSDEMNETIRQRAAVLAEALDMRNIDRVVPISALKNWNMYSLLTAMVSAAGESKGASLLRAVKPDTSGSEGAGGEQRSGEELGKRFGISTALRDKFRALIA